MPKIEFTPKDDYYGYFDVGGDMTPGEARAFLKERFPKGLPKNPSHPLMAIKVIAKGKKPRSLAKVIRKTRAVLGGWEDPVS